MSDMRHVAPGLQGANSHVGHGSLLAKHLGNAAGIPMSDMGICPLGCFLGTLDSHVRHETFGAGAAGCQFPCRTWKFACQTFGKCGWNSHVGHGEPSVLKLSHGAAVPMSDMGHMAPGLKGADFHVGHGKLLAKHWGDPAGIPMLDMGNGSFKVQPTSSGPLRSDSEKTSKT